jgi:hypothetical protein
LIQTSKSIKPKQAKYFSRNNGQGLLARILKKHEESEVTFFGKRRTKVESIRKRTVNLNNPN